MGVKFAELCNKQVFDEKGRTFRCFVFFLFSSGNNLYSIIRFLISSIIFFFCNLYLICLSDINSFSNILVVCPGNIILCNINLVTGIVFTRLLHSCKEDRIINYTFFIWLWFRADIRISTIFICPFLHEKNTGLCASMRFKHITMQTNNCENTAFFSFVITN